MATATGLRNAERGHWKQDERSAEKPVYQLKVAIIE
jgi:hypothetical protein